MKYLLIFALGLSISTMTQAQTTSSTTNDSEVVEFTPEFQEWWADHGYMIQSDVKITPDMPDISEVISTSGDHYLTEEIVSSDSFDPRTYMIVLPNDKPLVYTIGNTGKVLYFHSAYRALELHKRYQINQQAKLNR